MRDARRWICWRAVPDQHDQTRINKVPIDPCTDRPFESGSNWQTNPARWASFDEASAGDRPVGFVLGDGWIGLDFDDCIVAGKLAPWAARIVRTLGTYAEISPSGTGIKVFMQGTLPADAKTSQKCDAWAWELYGRDRYFTVTGDKLPGAPSEIAEHTSTLAEITGIVWGDDLIKLCKLRDLFLSEDAGNVHIQCPWAHEHSHGGGDKDAALQITEGQAVGFHCFHAHCAERTIRDVRKFFGVKRPGDEHINRVNDRYAVMSVGNKMVVAEFDHDQLVELWPFDEFKKKLIKEPRIGKKPLAEYWLEHPDGRHYNRLGYFMPGSREQMREDDYNGYQGFTVVPAPGDWSKNREHIRAIICAGQPEVYEWVINWMAALFQLPGRHAWSSIVLRGGEGIGKGHFADMMIGKSFHAQQYLHLIGANQLTAEFNEHFSGKVFIFGDETCWGGEKQAAEKLKGLITEDTILIHRKFLKAVGEPSALHIVIASNHEWPVAIPKDDRRFLVADVADDKRQDQEYFAGLRHELEHGGRAAMLYDLLQHQVNDAALRQPPDTGAKRDVKERTFSGEEVWLQNWLANIDGTWTNRVMKSALYEDYKRSLPHSVRPRSIMGFGKIFKKAGIEWRECKVDRHNSLEGTTAKVNGYLFPALDACRQAFDSALGVSSEWPVDENPEEAEPGSEPGQQSLKEVA